jgi:hypothetical protein
MASLDRQVSRIVIAPLYGVSSSFETVDDAIVFINNFSSESVPKDAVFEKLYIAVEYSNSDKITGEFSNKENAKQFLENIIKV